MMDLTTIIVAIVSAFTGVVGTLVGKGKRKADATAATLDNVSKAIGIWQNSALEAEKRNEMYSKQIIQKNEELTQAITKLEKALYAAKRCDYADNCPVIYKLNKLQNTTPANN